MSSQIHSVIIGTGKVIPNQIVKNSDFLNHKFYEKNGELISRDIEEIVTKFKYITEIEERRYAENDQMASDLGFIAAQQAIEDAKIDKETLDYVIVAHNFGDIKFGTTSVDLMPTLAARVKHKLGIQNPNCVAYDLPFGCPGWLQAMIHADYFIRSGDSSRILVIGTETLSRVVDPHDRDTMIFSDGAGATILEARTEGDAGIVCHKTVSHTFSEVDYLYSGKSNNQDFNDGMYIKMEGRKIYEYALTHVPMAIKATLDKAGLHINDIKKVLIHQANGKMDDAILRRLFKLYDIAEIPHGVMPMTISSLGNSSVATIPTMLNMLLKGELPEHDIASPGDLVIFASVGAGMNINAMVYRF